jgi:hypothetical protein
MTHIPAQVKKAAAELIEIYGESIDYIGIYKGKQVYLYRFPKDVEMGFPFYFLYDGKSVDVVSGFEALDLGSILLHD